MYLLYILLQKTLWVIIDDLILYMYKLYISLSLFKKLLALLKSRNNSGEESKTVS